MRKIAIQRTAENAAEVNWLFNQIEGTRRYCNGFPMWFHYDDGKIETSPVFLRGREFEICEDIIEFEFLYF